MIKYFKYFKPNLIGKTSGLMIVLLLLAWLHVLALHEREFPSNFQRENFNHSQINVFNANVDANGYTGVWIYSR